MNGDKTKIVVFKKGGFRNREMKFHFKGMDVENVNQLNCLGMVHSSSGCFMKATNTISSKTVEAMNILFVNVP